MSPRRRVYLIAAGVIALTFALFFWAPGFLKTVETKLYDLHFTRVSMSLAGTTRKHLALQRILPELEGQLTFAGRAPRTAPDPERSSPAPASAMQ